MLATGLTKVQNAAEVGTPSSPPVPEQLQQKLSFLSSGYCTVNFFLAAKQPYSKLHNFVIHLTLVYLMVFTCTKSKFIFSFLIHQTAM